MLQCDQCKDQCQADVEFNEESLRSGLIGTCMHDLHCANCADKGHDNVVHRANSQQCPECTRQVGSIWDNNHTPTEGQGVTQPSRRQRQKGHGKTATPNQLQGIATGNSFSLLNEQSLDSVPQTNGDLVMSDIHA